ncbi:MAG: DUF6370 family protein [Ferruginibacter sp.]
MTKIFTLIIIAIFPLAASAQHDIVKHQYKDSTYTAEIACGQCQFKMSGKSCDLAVRINGHAYFVDGSNIDDHGDAHADDGLCKKIRPAMVMGHIENGRFVARKVKLVPDKKG